MARSSLIERKPIAQKFEWVSANCKRNVRAIDSDENATNEGGQVSIPLVEYTSNLNRHQEMTTEFCRAATFLEA